uniref:PDEase domain-containing protein n=1 Tax=Entomoneis paludosa TaxID=265537 RepID=A0A7S2Y9H8_9STRA|mmetsp:Transcript_23696/g.49201  ORF Transcript_23696/g.49201 Transcript_23696/m.49201 type:complete len:357 (+) Transcript_23696:223-1293(+)
MRLVMWNVDVLSKSLIQIIARRKATGVVADSVETMRRAETRLSGHKLAMNEVEEIVQLPAFSGSKATSTENIKLPEAASQQLSSYVQALAAMYNSNPFHSFEHASHVTMSVTKLLSRIVAPDNEQATTSEASLHDHTYGITSDPLTQFAVILSALIHDADHPGVPNNQLIKEGSAMAKAYEEKSVAEQNSVDLAWQLLMDGQYADLRRAIYVNESELARFRQLIVNVVLATDIMDKELKALRNKRWELAFAEEGRQDEKALDSTNRKATIVLEHLIQASDVAHTMQVSSHTPDLLQFIHCILTNISFFSIGISTESGICASSWKCTKRMHKVGPKKTPPKVGIKVKLGFWIFMLFL